MFMPELLTSMPVRPILVLCQRHASLLVMSLLTLQGAMLAWSGYQHSPAYDEIAYLPAGVSHLELGRFGLARVSPPLVRLVAAVPVVLAGAKTDWSEYRDSPGSRAEWRVGDAFVRANGSNVFWLFTIARWACVPFSLIGGYVCYRWAKDLYGQVSGLAALTLWCFCPNLLAHGALVTPDVGTTAMGLLACYTFWRWLQRPTWLMTCLAGVALGLAESAKTTWIILYPVLFVLWAFWMWKGAPRPRPIAWLPGAVRLSVAFLISVDVLNMTYGFEGSMTPLGDYTFVSETLKGSTTPQNPRSDQNRFKGTLLAHVLVPLPRNYVLGIDTQKKDFELRFPAYLRGEWKDGGWWYYYLYGWLIKVPIGTWLLFALAVATTALYPSAHDNWANELVTFAPGVMLLAFVSSQTGLNHHVRYVLPALPFLLLWSSKAFSWQIQQNRPMLLIAVIALCGTIASSVSVLPHSMSYFNEAVGGPINGHAHLVDSNIDWGQDLLYLQRWLKEHPDARPFGLAYFGRVNPAQAGIQFQLPPYGPTGAAPAGDQPPELLGPQPGWYGVSVNFLRGCLSHAFDENGRTRHLDRAYYSYFLEFEPIATAGYSIYIYHISLEDANRVRAKLGLPALTKSEDRESTP